MPTNDITRAAIAYYQARRGKLQAHADLVAYRAEHGGCIGDDKDVGTCYEGYNDDWCAICLGSQPLWEARKTASYRVGTALRGLMRLCEKAEVRHNPLPMEV